MIKDYLFNPYFLLVNHIGEQADEPGGSFPERFTLFHELDVITKGVGPAVINGQTYRLEPGDVFYRVPGMHNQHFFPYHCYFFVFDPYFNAHAPRSLPFEVVNGTTPSPQAVWDPIPPFAFAKGPYLGRLKEPETIVSRARCIFTEYTSPTPDWLLIRGEFMLMLREISIQLNERGPSVAPQDKSSQYFQRMMSVQETVRQNVEHNWRLAEAAEIAQMSPNFFSRVFHELCDETFIEFVQRMKIKRAMLYLLDTNMTLAEIADQLGFCDVTYFQTVFRRHAGTTPNKFRKAIIHI